MQPTDMNVYRISLSADNTERNCCSKRSAELAFIPTTVVVYNEADISLVPSLDN